MSHIPNPSPKKNRTINIIIRLDPEFFSLFFIEIALHVSCVMCGEEGRKDDEADSQSTYAYFERKGFRKGTMVELFSKVLD